MLGHKAKSLLLQESYGRRNYSARTEYGVFVLYISGGNFSLHQGLKS
jgi:hypothetical protein